MPGAKNRAKGSISDVPASCSPALCHETHHPAVQGLQLFNRRGFLVWRTALCGCYWFGLIGVHDSTKRRQSAGESSRRDRPGSALRAKFYWSPVVWHLRQQIANTIHIVQTGGDPLVGALAAFNHGPYEVLIEACDYLQISAKGFESMSAPDIEARRRMPERSKVRVIDILVKDGGQKHSDTPMRRQRLIPRLDCLDFLKEVFNGVKNGRFHILRSRWPQRNEGVPHMVINRRPATEGP